MASVIIDNTLEFTFPDSWTFCIYEQSRMRKSIQRKVNSICCVDLILLNKIDSKMFIIEAKDFQDTATRDVESRYIRNDLTDHFARKFIHSIAGLTCAKMCGDIELRDFYRALLNPEIKKYVVSFVELGPLRNKRIKPSSSLIANLLLKMRTILQPLCCEKYFCDRQTIPPSYGWAVARVPIP